MGKRKEEPADSARPDGPNRTPFMETKDGKHAVHVSFSKAELADLVALATAKRTTVPGLIRNLTLAHLAGDDDAS